MGVLAWLYASLLALRPLLSVEISSLSPSTHAHASLNNGTILVTSKVGTTVIPCHPGNGGPEMSSHLPKVTELNTGRAVIGMKVWVALA